MPNLPSTPSSTGRRSLPTLPLLPSAESSTPAATPSTPSPQPIRGIPSDWVVRGMHCASCVTRVERLLNEVPGVVAAQVNLATHQARVWREADDPRASDARLIAALKRGGYEMEPIARGDDNPAATLRAEWDRAARQWRRRWVLGALLSVPTLILALVGEASFWGSALASLLALVTWSWVGWPFHQGAWRALGRGRANMEVLVSLGTTAALVAGTVAWWSGIGSETKHASHGAGAVHHLADVGIILTVVAFGKWLETRSRRGAGAALERLLDQTPRFASRLEPNAGEESDASAGIRTVPVQELRKGDRVRVRAGERVPVDGIIRSGRSAIDESLFTGESLPVPRGPGDWVLSGTINGGGLLVVEALRLGEETALAGIGAMVRSALASKTDAQRLADRVAAVFAPIVLGLAAVTLLGWLVWDDDATRAVWNAVAVLILACPCALGLATPMAVAVAVGRAAREGLIVRDAAALERLARVRLVLFDKTGTLTLGKPQVVAVQTTPALDALDAPRVWRAIAQGEAVSTHPLASAIEHYAREAAQSSVPSANGNVPEPNKRSLDGSHLHGDEITGRGVEAVVEGRTVRVGAPEWLEETSVDLTELRDWINQQRDEARAVVAAAVEGRAVAALALSDPIRPAAAELVAALRTRGLTVEMITGDGPRAASVVAQALGIPAKAVHSQVRPEQKRHWVESTRAQLVRDEPGAGVAMVGDGLNDAPALAAADVGLAMASGVDLARAAADLVIVGDDPLGVIRAWELSRATRETIRDNLIWAFAYNVVGLPLAALGAFGAWGPIVAACAMAGSSLVVVLRSLKLNHHPLRQRSAPPISHFTLSTPSHAWDRPS